MPLDINLFREEKGDIEKVRASQAKRFANPQVVDDIVQLDKEWRLLDFEVDQTNKELNQLAKDIGSKIKEIAIAKKDGKDVGAIEAEVEQKKFRVKELKARKDELEKLEPEKAAAVKAKLNLVGNLVHESVPLSQNEDENRVERTFGEPKPPMEGELLHHHELLHMIDGFASEQGVAVAGHRAYFLRGVGVLLNQALINYGLSFLMQHGYTPVQPPFFMNKDVMAATAQLEQFDEELYKVVTHRDKPEEEKYLIATSEQPISAYYKDSWLDPRDLPIKMAGYSTCFRKEAGSYGKDAWGIFRVHQFEKIEQFVFCEPEKSWDMQEEMITVAEKFFQSLGFSYRVINIVSGALNNAAARKYDLEAWFPTLACYRELVSCSNCTDYQARAMETRCGQKKMGDREKRYVHMLNATLCATERTICCLLENYQCAEGVRVPEVLQPFMGGLKLLKFVKERPLNINKIKTDKGQAKKDAGQDK